MLKNGPPGPPGVFEQDCQYRKWWPYTQYLADQFWQKMKKFYLPELQKRAKWLDVTENVSEGDLVLLVQSTPRNVWPLARVSKIFPSTDGLVRSVEVTTADGSTYQRPISKIVMLEGYLM